MKREFVPAILPALTLAHFCVDGVCGAALAAYAFDEPYLEPIVYYFGLYNLIAFGGQWCAGWFFDERPRTVLPALVVAAVFLAVGLVSSLPVWLWAAALGVGNCVFHAAAGGLVLRRYENFGPPGIFVSGGAVGLGLGLGGFCPAWLFFVLYVAAAVFVLSHCNTCLPSPMGRGDREAVGEVFANDYETSSVSPSGCQETCRWHVSPRRGRQDFVNYNAASNNNSSLPTGKVFACGLALLLCVVLRGFGGGGVSGAPVLLFPCVFALGKAAGGVLCDRVGYRKTILAIFLLGFFALQGEGLIFALLLAFAFNLTMPLTLRLLHRCAPARPGLMFGLAAGCLLPGAFYPGAVFVPASAMIVLQFLCLWLAGRVLGRGADVE